MPLRPLCILLALAACGVPEAGQTVDLPASSCAGAKGPPGTVDADLARLRREGAVTVTRTEPGYGGTFGLAARNGEVIIPATYDRIDFWGAEAAPLFRAKCGAKHGYLGPDGREVIPVAFDGVWEESEGLIGVWRDAAPLRGRLRDQAGFVDDQGRWAVAPIYDHVSPFEAGTARVVRDGYAGLIGRNGQVLLPLDRYVGLSPALGGHRSATLPDGRVGIVDARGRETVAPTFASVHLAGNGLATASLPAGRFADAEAFLREGAWGVITVDGEVVVPFEHEGLQLIYPIGPDHPWGGFAERTGRDLIAFSYGQDAEGRDTSFQIVGRGGAPLTDRWPSLEAWAAAGRPLAGGAAD